MNISLNSGSAAINSGSKVNNIKGMHSVSRYNKNNNLGGNNSGVSFKGINFDIFSAMFFSKPQSAKTAAKSLKPLNQMPSEDILIQMMPDSETAQKAYNMLSDEIKENIEWGFKNNIHLSAYDDKLQQTVPDDKKLINMMHQEISRYSYDEEDSLILTFSMLGKIYKAVKERNEKENIPISEAADISEIINKLKPSCSNSGAEMNREILEMHPCSSYTVNGEYNAAIKYADEHSGFMLKKIFSNPENPNLEKDVKFILDEIKNMSIEERLRQKPEAYFDKYDFNELNISEQEAEAVLKKLPENLQAYFLEYLNLGRYYKNLNADKKIINNIKNIVQSYAYSSPDAEINIEICDNTGEHKKTYVYKGGKGNKFLNGSDIPEFKDFDKLLKDNEKIGGIVINWEKNKCSRHEYDKIFERMQKILNECEKTDYNEGFSQIFVRLAGRWPASNPAARYIRGYNA